MAKNGQWFRRLNISALAILTTFSQQAQAVDEELKIQNVEVRAPAIDSRIMKYPATVETYDRQQIQESVNAATPAQTMKYLPSIQVRERFIGDRNGIIATRTIGAISSAQSLLYADGILLSNLLGNSFSYPPRWGMVGPEEIESISMMYGPFSSLYAGNSFGGVISIHTRMPEKFEAHANVQSFMQNFKLYGTDVTNWGNHQSASVGNKINDFSFWLGIDRLENQGQPMDFAVSVAKAPSLGGTLVTGAYQDISEKNMNRVIFGATSIDKSEQINTKFKATYDFTPEIKAAYTIGFWDIDGKTDVQSYLKDGNGNPIYTGSVNINGAKYNLSTASDAPTMSPSKTEAFHIMQAFELKSHTKGFFDWQFTLSDYDYQKDLNGSSRLTTALNLNPYITRTGRVNDLSGTGWTVFDARGTLRPQNHTLDFGYHIDDYQLRSTTTNSADWSAISKGNFNASSQGNTQTQALYVQDKWQLNQQWALTLGARQEFWQASEGRNQSTTSVANYQDKYSNKFSPKISLSFEPQPAWGFRAAFGQAYRFPTVTELYQQLASGSNILVNNPDLKPEEVLSAELTAERRFSSGLMRLSAFNEHKYDALLSQASLLNGATTTYVQNVDHIRTYGLEAATEWKDIFISGLDIRANATWTDAKVLQDDAEPSYVGKNAPRIPKQLYKAVATYRVNNDFTVSVGARYSGRQYINLDNSDVNPDTYIAASQFFLMDVKANYKFADRWMASVGVDNLTNDKAYVRHPLPHRTLYAQIKFDY
jgi:iron complex outermembrane receptor protein